MPYEIFLAAYLFLFVCMTGFLYKETNSNRKSSEYAIPIMSNNMARVLNDGKKDFVDKFFSYFDEMSDCQKETQKYVVSKSSLISKIEKCKTKDQLTQLFFEIQSNRYNYLVSIFKLTLNFKKDFMDHVIMCYITDGESACKIRDEFNNILEFLHNTLGENDFSKNDKFMELYDESVSFSKKQYIKNYNALLLKSEEEWRKFDIFAKLRDKILPKIKTFFSRTLEEKKIKERLDEWFGNLKENEYIDDIFFDKMFKMYFGKKKNSQKYNKKK